MIKRKLCFTKTAFNVTSEFLCLNAVLIYSNTSLVLLKLENSIKYSKKSFFKV